MVPLVVVLCVNEQATEFSILAFWNLKKAEAKICMCYYLGESDVLDYFNPFITAINICWSNPQYCKFLYNEWYCSFPNSTNTGSPKGV